MSVHLRGQTPKLDIQVFETEEVVIAQGEQHPALRDLHADFSLGLVLRFPGAGRQGCRIVVTQTLPVGRIDHHAIFLAAPHCRFQVVGHHPFRRAAQRVEAIDVAPHPVRRRLRGDRLQIRLVRVAEHRHEDLGVGRRTALAILDFHGPPGEVDEELFSRSVNATHHDVQTFVQRR